MTDQMDPPKRRQEGRSPAYPTVDLAKCMARVESLYKTEKQYPAPIASVLRNWGYSSLNGKAGLTVAALKKFGLLTDLGSKEDRRVQVTDLAVRILSHPNQTVRDEALREAALRPVAHKQMWEQYKAELPPDETVEWDLRHEKGFTESGAHEFVREYRTTLDYSGLAHLDLEDELDEVLDEEEGEEDPREEVSVTPIQSAQAPAPGAPQNQQQQRAPGRFLIPLPGGKTVSLDGDFPLDETDWAVFNAILTAMKPGLTVAPPPSALPAHATASAAAEDDEEGI